MCVVYDSYDYYGGAHGMPWYDRDMYDLTSGEHVDFIDLYKGSEDDFKRIVADYVDEYHKNNNDLFFASYDDYEEGALWEQYYEYTSLDTTYGYFTPDAYVIEYAPYELGPFASGFIDVPIPLNVLGIEF